MIAADFLYQLPKCTAFPGPMSVLIMDNTKIHHGDDVTDLVEAFGEHFICLSAIFLNLTTFRCAD